MLIPLKNKTNRPVIEIKPQPGPQEMAMASPADILIIGGAAGGGKTWIIEKEPLRHVKNPKFKCVTFMRLSTNILKPGSLWDKSFAAYPYFKGIPRQNPHLDWTFRSGSRIKFSGMEHEKNAYDWKGAEIPLIQFDQLEAFTEFQFFYMMSRLRSMSGINGYIRASCNPDPDSFLATLLEFWIDQRTGYADRSKSGVIRWFQRVGDKIIWESSKKILTEKLRDEFRMTAREIKPLSFSFIPADIYDNKILLEEDPAYLPYLMSLPYIERERLLKGNWKIRPAAGLIFRREKFKLCSMAPREKDTIIVRAWDKASTEGGNKDRTAGVKVSRTNGRYYVEDVVAVRYGPVEREELIRQVTVLDSMMEDKGHDIEVLLQQSPGDAGKTDVEDTIRNLAGFNVFAETLSNKGDKVKRARPAASQVEGGNVFVVSGPDNINSVEEFLVETHNFDGKDGHVDDIPDAFSSAMNFLMNYEEMLITSVKGKKK